MWSVNSAVLWEMKLNEEPTEEESSSSFENGSAFFRSLKCLLYTDTPWLRCVRESQCLLSVYDGHWAPLLLCCFSDRVTLCSSNLPGIHNNAQTGLKLAIIHQLPKCWNYGWKQTMSPSHIICEKKYFCKERKCPSVLSLKFLNDKI